VSQSATSILLGKRGSALGAAVKPRVTWSEVVVRPLGFQDVPSMLDFIYRSPRDIPFLQAIDFAVWPVEPQYRQKLNEAVQRPALLPAVAVEHNGRTVGVHLLQMNADGHADFEAYLWQTTDRGKGIASISWYKAAQYFFKNFPVETMIFRVPKDNVGAVAMARKLPLNLVGEEDVLTAGLKPGLRAKVYSLSRTEFEVLGSSTEDDDLDEESDI
jgi:hypothetical protein